MSAPDKPKLTPGAKALRLLARREYSRAELKARLAGDGADDAEIEAVLDDFARRGWLSETRYVEQVARARRERFGSLRIRQELEAKGVSGETIAATMQQLKDTDFEAARGVWRRKFGQAPSDARERARQLRFLQSRGFTVETAMRVLRTVADERDDPS